MMWRRRSRAEARRSSDPPTNDVKLEAVAAVVILGNDQRHAGTRVVDLVEQQPRRTSGGADTLADPAGKNGGADPCVRIGKGVAAAPQRLEERSPVGDLLLPEQTKQGR